MRPLSQHARSPPRPCCANLKPANPVERTPCLRLTLSPRGTSTACAPCSKKDPSFIQIAQELDVDILALQETKLQEGQVDIDLPGYHQTWSYAERKGYSGTAVFSRQEPLRVLRADALLPYAGEGEAAELVAQAATEGRVCALEFDKFWFVDVYTPKRAKRTRAHRCAHGLGRCLPRLFERA